MNPTKFNSDNFYGKVSELLKNARQNIVQSINYTMVSTYFEVGKLIVIEEQNGKNKATYGQAIIKKLSERLSKELGRGFSVTNIKQMRRFYLTYSIGQKSSDQFKLSWSHYLKSMIIKDINEKTTLMSQRPFRSSHHTILGHTHNQLYYYDNIIGVNYTYMTIYQYLHSCNIFS